MGVFRIGKVRLKNRLLLAPMVDVSDVAYRLICRKAGAAMGYTEMVYVDAILHENAKTKKLMIIGKREQPVGVQITGNSVEQFRKVVPFLRPYDIVDINCGCPSIRITRNKAGSHLLQHPSKIGTMIRILKDASLTATAKIRLGFKKNNVLEVAREIEKAGADALTVHGRLAIHGKDVAADWNWIERVKKQIGIPVIGNGDIFSGADAYRMLEIADGIMIARAAIGDPYIFSRILFYLRKGREQKFDATKNIPTFLEYIRLAEKYNLVDLNRIKYLGSRFIRHVKGAAGIREQLMSLKNIEEIKKFVCETKD